MLLLMLKTTSKMKKQTYLKKSHIYWTAKKINKHSMKIWYSIAILMGVVVAWAVINNIVNSGDLVSPNVLNPVKQVQAKEEVTVSCEDPKGYLECQVYNKRITWEQHDKISQIIKCESGWNPEAINTKNTNGSYDMGLVQINSIHKVKNSDKLNFKFSIDWMIKKVIKDGGYGAWSCANKLNIK